MRYLLHNTNKKMDVIRKLLAQESIDFKEAVALSGLSEEHSKQLLIDEQGVNFIKTNFHGAFLIKPKVFSDKRGFFVESYSDSVFKSAGIDVKFIQDNHSMSVEKGVLRGLHFQLPPYSQSKLVRVTRGAVYDVIVDLRKHSRTFGEWEGFILSRDNALQLFVPQGFAHGFCTLEENTEFMYKVDNFYAKEHDSGIAWNDSALNINWPTNTPILSEKDQKLQHFKYFKTPF
jgi:dTDP-4-dehydrorhamnose 3,5-epimerase